MGISQILLYGYGIICLSMILFNTVYSFILKRNDVRLERKIKKFEKEALRQIENIRNSEEIDKKHFEYLERKLTHVYNLIAFDKVLKKQYESGDSPELSAYLRSLKPVMLYLAVDYRKRDSLEAAYFLYFIGRYNYCGRMPMDSLQDIVVDYMNKHNLYCRVNALQALYCFGSVDNIVKAIDIQDKSGYFLHEKILQEGLLSYSGDHEQLICRLWDKFESFGEKTQLSVLNYIRYKSGAYLKEMYAIMQDEARGKELRISAIRYFGKYKYEPAKQLLLKFAMEDDPSRWEYAAISVNSLASYEGEDVEDILIKAMHSANWYVRYNAAVSLDAHNLSYENLLEIVGGNDRYAREMLLYRLSSNRLEQRKKAVTE